MSEHSFAIIEDTIANLRQLVKFATQASWHDLGDSSPVQGVLWGTATLVSLNEQDYIVFPSGKQVKWLAQRLVIPQTLGEYPLTGLSLRLVLTWWADDAQIFIDGELVQQGDLFDSTARVLITDCAIPGREYFVTIRLVSPGHDIGALMRSHLIYESATAIDPGMVADELTVLAKYLSQFQPADLPALAATLNEFSWDNVPQGDKFAADLNELRSQLLPLAREIKQRRFNLLGHAHLDMAWLWTTAETYEVAERTFKSVLNLQQDFPALKFGHTSPALYEWIEHHRPQLFASIQAAVGANSWELLGGMWIEPETNLVGGESLIRQLIYGQKYYQAKFDRLATVAWLPDSFGFTWQLPQIFQQCGIEYFVTGKLHWNDRTKFPHGCFWWESPDGTRLLTLMSPPNVTGVMDTNPITMTNYGVDWEVQTGLPEMFWLPGVGDHGGGPTRDMLEVAAKWNRSPFFPQVEFTTAAEYLKRINLSPKLPDPEHKSQREFPIWRDEIYLELHRGCYTVHADQKQYNRRCERLLYEAELWSTLATLLCGDRFDIQSLLSNVEIVSRKAALNLPDSAVGLQQLIEIAWKQVLFNQFHDILPGTSIPEVFVEANQGWEQAIAIGESVLQYALDNIATSIELTHAPQIDAIPVVVFNSLNWQRSQVITIESERLGDRDLDYGIHSATGARILIPCHRQENKLTFLAQDVPGVGYRLFWLCPEPIIDGGQGLTVDGDEDYEIGNEYLKVLINPNTGNIDSIYDVIAERETLSGQGNELQLFADEGQYWDAWNIDPDYEQKRLPDTELVALERIKTGLASVIRVVKKFNQSTFTQDYILERDSPMLKIVNRVDWQETHVMVKAAFPLDLRSDSVTYEIPCGTIERPTKPQTEDLKAKWEVSALNWADLTDLEQNYGVSLLNDCKYGYDAHENQLRLTLLRAATWPDPQSDRGIHQFTYSIYPHSGSWQEAKTVQQGYELNTPLRTVIPNRLNCKSDRQTLPPVRKLLHLSADNLILMALQLAENQTPIMRCYESLGKKAEFELKSDLNLILDKVIDCLQERQPQSDKLGQIKPHKIVTYQLKNIETQANS
ncbi:MAG: alpha-mannosidase [Cyanobacteria bacterium J06623_7]